MAAEHVKVYEAIKDESDKIVGLGNSYEVSVAEAKKLVRAGSHVQEGVPLGSSEKPQESEPVAAEVVEKSSN